MLEKPERAPKARAKSSTELCSGAVAEYGKLLAAMICLRHKKVVVKTFSCGQSAGIKIMSFESVPKVENNLERLKHETLRKLDTIKERVKFQEERIASMSQEELEALSEAAESASSKFAEIVMEGMERRRKTSG